MTEVNNTKNNEEHSISSDDVGDFAVVGEHTPNRMPVSIQQLQNIYHELTGKKEEVSRSYSDPYRIIQGDFEQLHLKLRQMFEQYHVTAETAEFRILYVNDTQDVFSSFDRFRAFNAGSPSPVESVLLKYNFLIVLPKLRQPQSYTLSIRITSPVAIEKKVREQLSEMPKILKLLGNRNAIVAVEYIDYMVARNVLDVVDGWFKTLSTSKVSAPVAFIRKRTSYIPLITRYVLGGFAAFLVFKAIPIVLTQSSNLQQFAYLLFASLVGVFATYKLAEHLGRAVEDALDRWAPIAYINLTAGDKKQIEEAESSNNKNILVAVSNLVGSFVVGVAVRLVSNWLTGV